MNQARHLPHDWYPDPLPENVEIGERSWLYSAYAFLHYRSECPQGVRIGHDTGIYIGTFFDLGPEGTVEIGDFCTLNGVTFAGNGRISIGNYVLIARQVVVSDTDFAAPAPSRDSGVDASSTHSEERCHITIEDDAWIGTGGILLPGAHIRRGAIVGAAAVVDFEVPPYAIAVGNPARIVGWARPQAECHATLG